MDKEQEKTAVKELLEDVIHGVFRARQDAHGIKSGDIEVMNVLKLDALTDLLVEHIARCILWEVMYVKE